jgi:hypothetical protein
VGTGQTTQQQHKQGSHVLTAADHEGVQPAEVCSCTVTVIRAPSQAPAHDRIATPPACLMYAASPAQVDDSRKSGEYRGQLSSRLREDNMQLQVSLQETSCQSIIRSHHAAAASTSPPGCIPLISQRAITRSADNMALQPSCSSNSTRFGAKHLASSSSTSATSPKTLLGLTCVVRCCPAGCSRPSGGSWCRPC